MAKKKKFAVIPRTKEAVLDGLKTGKGHRDFNGKSIMYISDPAEAREIEADYGQKGTGDVYVAEDAQYTRAMNNDGVDSVHNYTFSGVDMSGVKKARVGQRKFINGTEYRYVEIDGKLTLEPVPQKRRKGGREAEVE